MSKLIKFDPFAELNTLQRQFFGDDQLLPFKNTSIPTTDVYTQDNNLTVEAHLPNFEEKDINIQLDDQTLIISAQRHEKQEDKTKKYVVQESSTNFYRSISLSDRANVNQIKAHLDNGILKIVIPLEPLPEPTKIAISSKNKSNK